MNFKKLLFTITVFTVSLINAQEISVPAFGKGLVNIIGKDSTWSMNVAGRVQFLSTTIFEDGQDVQSNFLIRRSRLKLDGFFFTPKLE